MAKLTLLSSVDRLVAWDNQQDNKGKAFGLNVSVAIDGTVDPAWLAPPPPNPTGPTPPDMRLILWPWKWSVPLVRVFPLDANGDRLKDNTGNLVPPVDINLPKQDVSLVAKVDDVRKGLEKTFAHSVTQSQGNFQWQAPVNGTSKVSRDSDSKPWHTLLGKISTYPSPVPQILNLSFIFFVDFDSLYVDYDPKAKPVKKLFASPMKKVFAAPVLGAGNPYPSVNTGPGDPQFDLSKDPGKRVMVAAYDNVPGLPIQAYSSPCDLDVPTGDNFLNPATQWVGDPSGNNHFDEDWLSTLEPRLADAFDLSNCVLSFLKDPARLAVLNAGDNLRLCARMTLAALADIIGPGWIKGPDGRAVIDTVLSIAGAPPLSASDRQKLDSAILYAAAEDQRDLLKKLFTGKTTYAVLEPAPERLSLTQTIAELEGIRGSILDQSTLVGLVRAQWTKLFTSTLPNRVGDIPGMTAAVDLQATLPANTVDRRIRDLRRQMALSNLGRFWQDFIKCNAASDAGGRAMITNGVPAFLTYYLAKRFSLTAPPWPPNLNQPTATLAFSPPISNVPADLNAALILHVQGYGKQVVRTLTPPSPASSTPQANAAGPVPPTEVSRQPNETPHAITLQVDQLAPLPGDSFADLLNRFSGVGFLMREKGTSNWMCLNHADLDGGNGKIALDIPALVPYRITYRNDLRQVCASYDNRPLVADSPLSRPELTSWIDHPTAQFDVLIKLLYSPNAALPCLTFGKTYQFVVFAIANCGAIPPKLTAKATGPCTLASSLGDAAVNGATIRQVEYLRRVRLGAAQITDLSDPQRSMKVPVLPDKVQPRARDLAIFANAAGVDAQTPVILLAPDSWRGGVSFVDALITRPGTHWDCWHRWVKGSVDDATRKKVIGDFFRTAQKNSTRADDPKVVKYPLTVDDPALAPWFYFELKECLPDGTLNAGQHLWVRISEASFGNTLASRRAPAIPFTCVYSDSTEGLSPRPAAGTQPAGATITARSGKVYQLGVHCAMTSAARDRFAPGIITGNQVTNDIDKNNYYLVSSHFFAVEAVTADLPDAGVVWNALQIPAFPTGGQQIVVNLNALGPHVHRAELTRQVWRWQGRNTAIHPCLISFTPALPQAQLDERILEWEAVEFGDRPDVDSTIVPMQPKTVGPDGSRPFTYSEALQTAQGDFDLRSLHFRFAVTAYSRYEGLIPSTLKTSRTGTTMIKPVPLNTVAGANGNGRPPAAALQGTEVASVWKSLFVPCRRTTDIHAPRVRLILPLTEAAASDPAPSPGLLVVFDEPWHESGGLAERLEARVALTADPTEDSTQLKDYFFEMGPDPIVGHQILPNLSRSWDPSTTAGQAAVSVPWPGIVGPVGHYFDPTNSAALFTATSFIIPAPVVAGDAAGERRWYFAKLQFRRTLVNSVQELQPPATGRPGQYKIIDAVSGPYSDPLWTQYLPPFSIFEKTALLSGGIQATISADRKQLFLIKGRQPHRLQAMPSDNNSFSLYAVLTRRVIDIAGRADQEQFLGLFSQGGGNGWNLADPTTIQTPDTNYRVRIIEVQRPKPANPNVKLWDELFAAAGADALARIVRISEPIDSVPELAGLCEGN